MGANHLKCGRNPLIVGESTCRRSVLWATFNIRDNKGNVEWLLKQILKPFAPGLCHFLDLTTNSKLLSSSFQHEAGGEKEN